MSLYSSLLRPVLFHLDPEWVHDRAIQATRVMWPLPPVRWLLSGLYRYCDPCLESVVCGIRFPNPVGLAAGFDKNGQAVAALAAMGFGYVEIGSISADPSEGNPKPRLWRLPQDRAICVHYGLPNIGAAAVARHLEKSRLPVPLGINIVKTNRGIDAPPDSTDAIIADYVRSVRILKDRGDYLSLNLSCPNTEMGRDFFAEPGNLRLLLTALRDLDISRPVFLKISPLYGPRGLDQVLTAVEGMDFISGFIFNLPPGKPDGLATPERVHQSMRGAVSGQPVARLIDDCIRALYLMMDRRRYRIIGAGGIFCAEDAYRKIRLGASLVQILTAMIYEGPGVIKSINRGLCRLLERDGFKTIAEAVGTAARLR